MINAKLVVVGGATDNEEVELHLPAVLGRGRDVTVSLPHPLVSRRHCELFETDERLMVRDLGSTNGTFVGSERVVESVLGSGELLTIGTVTFRAIYGDAHDERSESRLDHGDAKVSSQVEDETERINGDRGTTNLISSTKLTSRPNTPPKDLRHPMPTSEHIEAAREETLP